MPNLIQSNIWKIYLFNFFISLHFVGAVLIPFFLDWGKISFFQVMILQTWFVIWVFLLEIPTGAIADFWGRKTSLALACLVSALGAFVYASQPEFLMFLLGEFLLALGFALLSGASDALIYDSLKTEGQENISKKVFGRVTSFSMLGLMVAAPIGSIVATSLGLRWTMLLMATPFTIAFFIALTLKEPKTKTKDESPRYLQILFGGVKYFYNHKILKTLAIDSVVIGILIFFLIWTYQLLLKQLGVNLVYFGLINALMIGSQIIVMNNFERLEKIFGSKTKYLTFSALISGIAFVFLGINPYVIPAIVGIIIISAFGISRIVLISNYIQKHVESSNRATVLSTISMLRRFGLAIGYPLVGLMVEWSLNYALIILGTIIIIFSLTSKVKEAYLID